MAELCGAKKRGGPGSCGRPAGWGTDHPGFGYCKFHTGSTADGRTFAARQAATAEAARLGMALDVDPGEALLECVRLDASEVAFLGNQVRELRDGDALSDEGLHPTVRAFQAARDTLARHSKLALDAGIDERRVALVESMGQQVGAVLRRVIEDVDLSAAQQAQLRESMARHLPTLGVIDQQPGELVA